MTPSLVLVTLLAVAVFALVLWALGLRRRLAGAHRALLERGAELSGQREEAGRLATGEALFRRIVESADDIIYRTDALGRFEYVNPAAEEAFSLSEAELLGRPFLDVVRPDYREEARRYYEDQREQEIPNTYCEFPLVTRGGEDHWVGQRVQRLAEDGRFAGLQAVARDITERKLLQQAIERERGQLRQIVTHAPVAMAMLDREGRHLAHSGRWLRYLRRRGPVGGRAAPATRSGRGCRARYRRGLRAGPRRRGGERARGRARARGRHAGLPALDGASLARREGRCRRGGARGRRASTSSCGRGRPRSRPRGSSRSSWPT